MSHYLTHHLLFHILVFQAIILLNIFLNYFALRKTGHQPRPESYPSLSVLIPARNEERNIARCVQSLLRQDYPDFEVIVLDDQSTDATKSILEKLACNQPRLQVVDGKPAPGGVVGKNWACHQLSELARGDILYFTDADTIHQSHALKTYAAILEGENADFLTGFPRQEIKSPGECLLVPFFSWASLSFLSLHLAYLTNWPVFSSAVGQIMLFRRRAYQTIGGHLAVASSIVEDMQLARVVKQHSLRLRIINAVDLVTCRMYHDTGETLQGFRKNLFAVFGFRIIPFLFVFCWLAILFWMPITTLSLRAIGILPDHSVWTASACVASSLLVWGIPYRLLKLPTGLVFLYPITMVYVELAAFQSLWYTLTGKLSWKGRDLNPPRLRWM